MDIKSISKLVVATAAFLVLGTAHGAEPDPKLAAVQQKVASIFDMVKPEDVTPSPIDGWYLIHAGPIVAFVSEDGRYLLQGDVIDLDTRDNVSERIRNQGRAELMASIHEEDVILFSPAETKYTVNIFTDVDCTYCRRLHAQIGEYLEQGIEVRYFLYPRNGPNAPAWATMEEVWCSNDRGSALTAAKQDRKFASTNCDASKVAEHYELGQQVGLTGTPAIVFEDGTLLSGYLPPNQLRMRLDLMAASN